MGVAFLVRHATHDLLGKTLVGRGSGVTLNSGGRDQSERVAKRLARERPSALLSSPLERCMGTASAIGQACALPVKPADALLEIDFGAWSGCSFAELGEDSRWAAWNEHRGSARCPGGESMLEAQARIVRLLEERRERDAVLVTHGDMIKVALCWALGLSLDFVHRFDIAPGSVSAIALANGPPRALWLNETC